MDQRTLVFFIVLGMLQMFAVGTISDGHCTKESVTRNSLHLTVDRKMNVSDGQWVTAFSARRVDPGNSTAADLKLEATHSTAECQGNRVTHVEMVVKDVQGNHSTVGGLNRDGLLFHHRHARNVVIFNGGLSAQRINLEDLVNSAAFTNRPLKDNEMFEVRLDKRYHADKSHCPGIGVMAHSPDDIKLYGSMYNSDGTWIYHNVNIYGGNKIVVPNYGVNSCNIEVGDTVGVMKRDNGSLHFYVKGVDQGPAISNAPSVLYGIYEVRGIAAIATILGRSEN